MTTKTKFDKLDVAIKDAIIELIQDCYTLQTNSHAQRPGFIAGQIRAISFEETAPHIPTVFLSQARLTRAYNIISAYILAMALIIYNRVYNYELILAVHFIVIGYVFNDP